MDFKGTRDRLQDFEFSRLFVEELGWARPTGRLTRALTIAGENFNWQQIASLSGVAALEVTAEDGKIPDAKHRAAIHKEISKTYHENLLIFVDAERTQSLWYWVKREKGKTFLRDHYFVRGQPGDLFLSKLSAMVVDISELDESGNIPVTEAARRLKAALDVEKVTKKFFNEFKDEHAKLLGQIEGIDDDRDRRWYASVLLNRLMFVYFLQRKLFLDAGNGNYLQDKLAESKRRGPDGYYGEFLTALFFHGFARPTDPNDAADAAARKLVGQIPYLNGGLFLKHRIEERWPDIAICDAAFDDLLSLFSRYSWNLNDTPGGDDNEISPDTLGYIFEKYINQKAFGAYYTRPEITEYLCEQTIHRLILDKMNAPAVPGIAPARDFKAIEDLLMALDAPMCHKLLEDVLPSLSLLDPACGSGAFLVAAMKTLINVYSAVVGRIKFLTDRGLTAWLEKTEREHPSLQYYIKKRIITDNLYGVDIMAESIEIAKLRLFLALVSSAQSVDQLEPLPNIDFNILAGNSLIGLMQIEENDFDKRASLFRKSYRELVNEKDAAVRAYKDGQSYTGNLQALRGEIAAMKQEAQETLNDMLLSEFAGLGIRFEQATWDVAKGKEGKPVKRALTIADIEALQPFHWGYEFDDILQRRGGFDAIITNPPWEIFKPDAKEFFASYSDLVTKNKMTIGEFEQKQVALLLNPQVQKAWLDYQSKFPHISLYYRSAEQYKNQISIVNGKRAGTDINLYKLFTEKAYNLLRVGGQCGIIVPSGIYTDLGTKQLRALLFEEARIEALFGFSNEKFIFESVHHSFKFCLLVFESHSKTSTFRTAFRINPREAISQDKIEYFLHADSEHVDYSIELIKRLSPDSLSITEFRGDADISIAQKMLKFPLLGEHIDGVWNLVLSNEFHMTNDSSVFRSAPTTNSLPLFTGKMFNQFVLTNEASGYWINEAEGRLALLGRSQDIGQTMDYQSYRWVHRRIARSTDTRTLISTITPKRVFTEINSTTVKVAASGLSTADMLFLTAFTNSFVLDWLLRLRVTTTLNMFYIYQLPMPRLTKANPIFDPVVQRVARLICTTPEFDDLAREVGMSPLPASRGPQGGSVYGVTDLAERARLRAELDGIVAHLYGLTEEEFAHVLSTFPLVPDPVKVAAQNAYRDIERGLIVPKGTIRPPGSESAEEIALRALIARGETDAVEFKVAASWNPHRKTPDVTMRDNIIQGVAAFLNSPTGGTLLIGIASDKSVTGLEDDFKAVNPTKPGTDTYERFLRTTIAEACGGHCAPFYTVTFPELDGRTLCRIDVKPASEPVYVSGQFYVRDGGGKRKLTPQETLKYVATRWGS